MATQKVYFPTKQEAINVIALTDGTETMAQLSTRLSALATSGITAYFDTSAITTTPQSKLVSALIDTTAGKIRFDDKLTGRIYIGPYDATMTIATALSRMVESYVYLEVAATTLDGVTVTGQTVSLYEGTDAATGRLVETAAYNGSPVTFMVPRNMEYFISITSTLAQHFQPNTLQGTASASASLTITYQDVSNITDYAGLVAFKNVVEADSSIADKAAYLKSAVLGKEIADTFTATNGTVYDNPMVVVGANYYTGEDNQQHLGLMMQRKWASSYDTMFDAEEGVVCDSATETTAEAGISYYGLAIGETSKTAANLTLLELATGATLPYGDYAKIYKCAIRDTTRNILQYGYNNWRDSAYRQHLNSSAAAGAWWTATHVGDAAPSNLDSVRGYMAGCSSALLAAAKKVKVATWPNYITDGANNVSTVYETLDTFFLPSISEMYGSSNRNGVLAVEGYLNDYWKQRCELESPSDAANSNRIQYRELAVGSTATRSSATVRLRSAHRGYSNGVWYVTTSGQVHYNGAYNAFASVPACVIY